MLDECFLEQMKVVRSCSRTRQTLLSYVTIDGPGGAATGHRVLTNLSRCSPTVTRLLPWNLRQELCG